GSLVVEEADPAQQTTPVDVHASQGTPAGPQLSKFPSQINLAQLRLQHMHQQLLAQRQMQQVQQRRPNPNVPPQTMVMNNSRPQGPPAHQQAMANQQGQRFVAVQNINPRANGLMMPQQPLRYPPPEMHMHNIPRRGPAPGHVRAPYMGQKQVRAPPLIHEPREGVQVYTLTASRGIRPRCLLFSGRFLVTRASATRGPAPPPPVQPSAVWPAEMGRASPHPSWSWCPPQQTPSTSLPCLM
ncbi:hypothetical protein GDO81_018830, partial [Engystomops pustulosus]